MLVGLQKWFWTCCLVTESVIFSIPQIPKIANFLHTLKIAFQTSNDIPLCRQRSTQMIPAFLFFSVSEVDEVNERGRSHSRRSRWVSVPLLVLAAQTKCSLREVNVFANQYQPSSDKAKLSLECGFDTELHCQNWKLCPQPI